jgi:hypothetical protein
MAILEYDLRIVGEQNIARSLTSVERRFVTHQARINRTLSAGGGRMRQRAQSPGQAAREAVRSNAQIINSMSLADRKAFESQRRYEIASHREKLRGIERAKREEIAAVRAVRVARDREQKAAHKTFQRAIGTGGSNAVGRLASVGKTGVAMLGVGGSVLAGAAVSESLKLDEQARRLSIAGRGKGEAGVDPETLRKQFIQTGLSSGIAPEQVASGVAAYVAKTGDLKTAMANRDTYATVAQGADADITEVFGAAADLADKMDIKSVQDMATAFAILSAQGKKGSFELKAMAAQFPEVFSSAANAGAKGMQGVRDVGATMQLAMKATGNSSEAATAVNSMFRQMAAKATDMQSGKAFGGRKVQVYQGGDPTKNMNNFAQVAQDAISASRGNVGQLNEVFDARGVKAINPLVNAYKTAYNANGGGEKGDKAGRAAMSGIFEEFSKVSADFSEVQRDASDAMKASSVQLDVAFMELKQAIAAELLPTVRDLVPQIKELAPTVRDVTKGLVELAGFAAENPFATVGAVLAASVAAEVGKAQLASVISAQMTPALLAASASVLKFAGAAGLAAAAVYATYDQNESLKKETGGKGILDVGWEWATTDKGLKEIADENLDKQAKAEAAARWRSALGEGPTAGFAPGGSLAPGSIDPSTGIVTSPAAPPQPGSRAASASVSTAKVEGGAELVKAASALTEAAGALKANGGTPGSLNRTSSPSPVKG